jgi:hypothetical protein
MKIFDIGIRYATVIFVGLAFCLIATDAAPEVYKKSQDAWFRLNHAPLTSRPLQSWEKRNWMLK